MNGETNQKQKTGICAKLALACAAIGLVAVLPVKQPKQKEEEPEEETLAAE